MQAHKLQFNGKYLRQTMSLSMKGVPVFEGEHRILFYVLWCGCSIPNLSTSSLIINK